MIILDKEKKYILTTNSTDVCDETEHLILPYRKQLDQKTNNQNLCLRAGVWPHFFEGMRPQS